MYDSQNNSFLYYIVHTALTQNNTTNFQSYRAQASTAA
jgi:hypothetical protein